MNPITGRITSSQPLPLSVLLAGVPESISAQGEGQLPENGSEGEPALYELTLTLSTDAMTMRQTAGRTSASSQYLWAADGEVPWQLGTSLAVSDWPEGWYEVTARLVDPLGHRATNVFDAVGNQVAQVNPLGYATTNVYDAANRQVAVIDPLARATTTVFDAAGRPTATVDALGNRYTTVFDEASRVVASVNPLGHRTTTIHDAAGRNVGTIDPHGNRATAVYDEADRPIATIDPLGQRTTTVLDLAGRAAATIDALGHRTTYPRDAAGRQTAIMNARGAVTTTVYDPTGRMQAIVDALGNRTTLGYDAAGRRVSATNALGYTSTTVYDAAGRAGASTDPLGYRTTFSYDAAGRQIAQVNPLAYRTTAVYDAGGQKVATVNPLGHRTTLSYDATGRQIATIDANGNISTRVYDEVGRPAAEVNALSHRTTSVYNAVGWRTAIMDANGGRNTYTHDTTGRIVEHADPVGRITTFSYDAAGRQTAILDARGVRATFQYDAANRLTTRTSTNDPPITFGYDAVGNHTEAIDGTGRSTFSYDLLNRRLTAIDPVGNAITYTYDAIGKRATMTAPDGGIFTYAYSARGQIAHLVNPQGDLTTFGYDAAGRRSLTELANGTRASYTYDGASRVTQLYNLKADDSVILGLTYEHDSAGNPIGILESGGDRVTWTYDATDRLTREQRSGASAYDTTYTYDPLGNRLVKEASGALTTYAYDLANQLTTSQDASGVTTYTYDLAGNLQLVEQPSGQRTTNTWDDQNRQTAVLLPAGGTVTSAYRFDGLRHEKADSEGVTKYVWDFQNYLAETDAADTIEAVYTNEPQQYGNLISQYRKGPTIWVPSYYQYDGLGSARVLTDEGGDVVDTYLYDAWGNEVAVSGSTGNPFRWVGQVAYYWDDSTGTFYIRARVYEPVIGRWMLQDPLFYPVASALRGINLYHYVRNGPTVRLDPSGEAAATFDPKVDVWQDVTHKGCSGCGNFDWEVKVTVVNLTGYDDPRRSPFAILQRICFDRTHLYCRRENGGRCCPDDRRKQLKCCHNEYLGSVMLGANKVWYFEGASGKKLKDNFIIDHLAFSGGGDGDCHSKGSGTITTDLYVVPYIAEYDEIRNNNATIRLKCGDFAVEVGKGPDSIPVERAIGGAWSRLSGTWDCCPKEKNHCSSGHITLGGIGGPLP